MKFFRRLNEKKFKKFDGKQLIRGGCSLKESALKDLTLK